MNIDPSKVDALLEEIEAISSKHGGRALYRAAVQRWVLEMRQSLVTLTGYQLRAALKFVAPDGEAEQLESDVTIHYGTAEQGHSGAGYYCCITEYPEEGSIFLDSAATSPESVDEGHCFAGPPPDAEAILAGLAKADTALLDSLRECLALVMIKYGNLSPDVNEIVARAKALIPDATPAHTTCPTCSIGNPGTCVKNGVMYCPHRPEPAQESAGDAPSDTFAQCMDTSDATAVTQQEIVSAVNHHAREIARLTETWPAKPDDGQPYRVRAFWSPCRKYLLNVCVSVDDISIVDDDGDLWGAAGAEHRFTDKPDHCVVRPECRITEYDGAYRCTVHRRKWGAISHPDEPCAGWVRP